MEHRKAISGRGGPHRAHEGVRNDRLKQVLLRDKPEVIRLRPKHFFPLLNRGKKVYLSPSLLPLKPLRSFLAGITGLGRTSILVYAFIYRPLLFLSTPSIPSHPLFLTPFLTPPIPSLLLLFSSFSFCSSPFSLLPSFSFVDTRLSRWFEEQSLHSPTSSAVFLLLFRRPLPLPPSRLIIRMIPLEHSSFRVFSHDWRWF